MRATLTFTFFGFPSARPRPYSPARTPGITVMMLTMMIMSLTMMTFADEDDIDDDDDDVNDDER